MRHLQGSTAWLQQDGRLKPKESPTIPHVPDAAWGSNPRFEVSKTKFLPFSLWKATVAVAPLVSPKITQGVHAPLAG